MYGAPIAKGVNLGVTGSVGPASTGFSKGRHP